MAPGPELLASSLELKVELSIATLAGDIVAELVVAGSTTILQLRRKLAAQDNTGTPLSRLRLVLGTRVLPDELAVKDLVHRESAQSFPVTLPLHLHLIRAHTCCVQSRGCPTGGVDVTYKVLVVGDAAVGKSALVSRAADEPLAAGSQKAMTSTLTFVVNSDTCIQMQVWDMKGQPEFRDALVAHCRSADCVIVVYDITSKESFDNVQAWIKLIEWRCSASVLTSLVGNKQDLAANRKVSLEEASAVAARFGLDYHEVSAHENAGVEALFRSQCDILVDRFL